jgi:hypothetical protein
MWVRVQVWVQVRAFGAMKALVVCAVLRPRVAMLPIQAMQVAPRA